MSDSGIGMLLGQLSANLLWLWFIEHSCSAGSSSLA